MHLSAWPVRCQTDSVAVALQVSEVTVSGCSWSAGQQSVTGCLTSLARAASEPKGWREQYLLGL